MTLGALLVSAAACGSSGKAKSVKAPTADFVQAAPQLHIEEELVAAPEAQRMIQPGDLVPFELDRAQLTEVGYAQVDTAARWLKKHPSYKLVLEGHADAIGRVPYNDDLATRRMAVVRQRMLQHGTASDRILMITFGEREAMELGNPLHPADRKVVMYATELSPRAVVAVVAENRPAIVASWTERGAPMQATHGLERPPVQQTVRR